MEPKTKTFWFIILAFLVGGIGGGFVGSSYFGKKNQNRNRPSRAEIRKEFSTRLMLDEKQQTFVDSMVEFHRSKINAVSQQYSELFKSQRDTLRTEIRKVLTPEQNARYDEFIKEIDERELKRRQEPEKH
ncbi:MAG TPA: hypothetical protein VII11_09625 [Bacteroidota bacterium]